MTKDSDIKLLLVEDEVIIAHNLKSNLQDLGFEVVKCCYNYEDALDAIHNLNFDILLTDINLGHKEFTGVHLATKAKMTNNIPSIFLTAYSDIEIVLSATRLNPAGYIVKPISIPTLFATIHHAIDNYLFDRKIEDVESKSDDPFIYTKTGNKLKKVFWNQVYKISVTKNYVILTTANKSNHLVRSSLSHFLDNIMPKDIFSQFLQISRNELINRKFIQKIEGNQVYIQNEVYLITKKSVDRT